MVSYYQEKLGALSVSSEGLAKLLYPFAEIVIHDIKSDSIVKIFNSFSKRRPKDRSFLELPELKKNQSFFGPYTKNNWDGRPLKSLTFIERDAKGAPLLLQCINIDVSFFNAAHQQIGMFLNLTDDASLPGLEALFEENIYEKINNFVTAWTKKHNLSIQHIKKEERKNLIIALHKNGAFEKKNAAEYVARVLGVSRASVYNYLKE